MKIAFEKWLDDNEIPEEASALFKESIICYKISAYRSAFIMSYIAFQNILKTRMLKATSTPTGIPATWWANICAELGDDDKWDNAVADCVKRNNPDRVFIINAAIVSEYEAHRVTRNKCAHGKTGRIDHYHVEVLWNFIQENFYRFVVNGGKAGLFQDIKNHYDKTITPPGTDVSYIIERIKLGVLDSDLNDLIKEVFDYSEQETLPFGSVFSKYNRLIDLWDKLVNESNERIQDEIVNFIITEKSDKVCDFVGRYPATADKFLSDSAFARKLWTGLLKECRYDQEGFWALLDRIITRRMVPVSEQADFDKLVYSSVGKSFPTDKVPLLQQTGYFDKLKKSLFTLTDYCAPGGITHANTVEIPFVHYVSIFGLEKESVLCINQIFSFATYGSFYNSICRMMKKEERLSEYKQIVSDENLTDYSARFVDEE